jgi:hypothetical protein
MIGVSLEISTWFIELVIEFQIKVVRLKVHNRKNGRHGSRNFSSR